MRSADTERPRARPDHRVGRLAALAALATFAAVAAVVGAALPAGAQDRFPDPSRPHHTPDGFRNNYPHDPPASFWAWQWERATQGVPQAPPGGWSFPVDRPDVAFLKSNRTVDTVTWIGHATLLLQVGGRNVLTDPQFSNRASPVPFAGPRRVVPPALSLDELPRIDVVLISHNHYDHLDEDSVTALAAQRGGPPKFYVPLGVKAWFDDRGIPVEAEMDWWDRRDDGPLAIHFVPAQHWSSRTPFDRNRTLWGGFVVERGDWRFIYTGDTGYSADFRDIAARFGRFDLAAIPIGAYAPRWFMRSFHADPDEAVRIRADLRAERALGVHWGTFPLTDEAMDEPPRRLAEARAAAGLPDDAFWVFRHGETRRLPGTTASGSGGGAEGARATASAPARANVPAVAKTP